MTQALRFEIIARVPLDKCLTYTLKYNKNKLALLYPNLWADSDKYWRKIINSLEMMLEMTKYQRIKR